MTLAEKPQRVQFGKIEASMYEYDRQQIDKFVRERVEFRPGGELAEGESLGEIEAILVSQEDPSLWVMIFELGGGDGGWFQLYNNLAGKVYGLRVREARTFSSRSYKRTVPLVVVEKDGRRVAVQFHKIDRKVTYRAEDGERYGWNVYGVSAVGRDQEMRGVLLSYAFQFVNEWSLGNGAYSWQRYHQDYVKGLERDWARFR